MVDIFLLVPHTLAGSTCQLNNCPVKVMEILGEKITTLQGCVGAPGREGRGGRELFVFS